MSDCRFFVPLTLLTANAYAQGRPLLHVAALDLAEMHAADRAIAQDARGTHIAMLAQVFAGQCQAIGQALEDAGDLAGLRTGCLLLESVIAERDELPLMRAMLSRNAALTRPSAIAVKWPAPWKLTFLTPDYADMGAGLRHKLATEARGEASVLPHSAGQGSLQALRPAEGVSATHSRTCSHWHGYHQCMQCLRKKGCDPSCSLLMRDRDTVTSSLLQVAYCRRRQLELLSLNSTSSST